MNNPSILCLLQNKGLPLQLSSAQLYMCCHLLHKPTHIQHYTKSLGIGEVLHQCEGLIGRVLRKYLCAGVAADMLDFMLDFMDAHPDLKDNDVFITGESYAGHYVPAVTHRLWRWNEANATDDHQINVKGLAIGMFSFWISGFCRMQYCVCLDKELMLQMWARSMSARNTKAPSCLFF